MSKNKMRLIGLIGVLSAVVAMPAAAQGRQVDYDFARVVDSQPIFEEVRISEPQEVCWNEPVRYPRGNYVYHRPHSATPSVVGGIIGGLIGNQFGHGSGRAASTAAGFMLGAAVGTDVAHQNGGYYRAPPPPVQIGYRRVCDLQEDYRSEQRLVGYDVTYEYNGRIGHTRTEIAPGQEIRVRVSVDPVGY